MSGPRFEHHERMPDGTTRVTYSPLHIQVPLSGPQMSALECAGVFELPVEELDEGERLLVEGISFSCLELLGRDQIEKVISAITSLANAEDQMAEDSGRDPAQRAGDRGARHR